MTGGCQCGAYALTGKPFCYFHSRLHRDARKPVSLIDSIDIPLLEDRRSIQLVITRVLRALVNKTIDRQTASTLLYGLQLALQGVAHDHYDVRFNCVKALSHTRDGDEVAADPDHPELEDDEYEEDNQGDGELEADEEDTEGDDGEEDDEDDNPSTEQLITDLQYLQSISLALEANDMKQVTQLISGG
jgi:hypothetical protein